MKYLKNGAIKIDRTVPVRPGKLRKRVMSISELERLNEYSFEIGPIRPPSEGGSYSLLIRATRNCPWSLCKFCYGTLYNRERFELRPLEEIRRDIKTMKLISDDLTSAIQKLGSDLVQTELHFVSSPSVIPVFNWLASGGRTAFLQDADSLVMRTSELLEVIARAGELNNSVCFDRSNWVFIFQRFSDEL